MGKPYRIGVTETKGLGIFSIKDIPVDEKIGSWINKQKIGRYLNNGWSETLDLGRYCNHSDNPNTYYKIEHNQVILYSKGIKEGDEILVNYLDAQEITGFKVNTNFKKT